jgi:pyruvate formate lyase activating enzyme
MELKNGFIELNRNLCVDCGTCTDTCYAGALSMSGRKITADKIMERLISSKPYFENGGGGVTFSGGECMLQINFLEAVLRSCKENGIHTAIDTAGHLPYEYFSRVLPYTDLFLYDIKADSNDLHKSLTGVSGTLIWENLAKLLADGAEVYVRIPCIPGANWHELPDIARRLAEYPVKTIELCPYHRLGEGKFGFMGMEVLRYETPSNQEMEGLLPLFEKEGRKVNKQ